MALRKIIPEEEIELFTQEVREIMQSASRAGLHNPDLVRSAEGLVHFSRSQGLSLSADFLNLTESAFGDLTEPLAGTCVATIEDPRVGFVMASIVEKAKARGLLEGRLEGNFPKKPCLIDIIY
jgi:hypothetical protein